MFIRLTIITVLALMLVGCAPTRSETGDLPQTLVSASNVAPVLGIVTNEQLQVVELMKGGAAEASGLKVGDTLIDLQWIPTVGPDPTVTSAPSMTSVPSDAEPVAAGAAPAEPVKPTEVVVSPELLTPIPAPTIPPEQYMPRIAVPFTAITDTIQLIGAGFSLKLRYQRDGQIFEMTIKPDIGVFHPLAPGEGTPTPIPDGYYWY